MDVAGWLQGLGLGQYEQAFRENDVDAEVLPALTTEDLIALGVVSVGHRRKLLSAIVALQDERALADKKAAPLGSSPPQEATGLSISGAERRQLTVMFCDMVGSTALASRLDPEDLREVVAAYHRTVTDLIRSFDGYVAKYMGDGVLVYFGYPQAHEDDAERAVRAGLGLIDAVDRLDVKSATLQARVGIATGLVVVGDLLGEGSAQEQSVVGETPNLAARLQTLAEPDTVVIAASTRRLIGGLFDCRDLGTIEIKGIPRPVQTWRVLRPSVVASRFEALRGSALSPMVGRDEEIDLLLRRWARVKAGDGQVVLISGEPGIGKSRVAAAMEDRLQDESHIQLRYFCSPYHQDSALYPFIDQLGRAAGFALDDTPASKLEELEALLALALPPDEDVALIADLLSLPPSERHPLPNLSPQRKKERTLEALLGQLEGLARQRPVVMVFEDAHWIDPTSRELLDLMIERISSLPVLLIVTFRPEFHPPWTGQPRVTMLPLNRLDRRDRTAVAERVAGGKELPDEIVDQIVERSDGVPLFVEELTKSVLESGLLREEAERYVLDRALPPFAVPTTLDASLMARLDRLSPAKGVAQVGAAIGREFSYPLLRVVCRLPDDELLSALDRLVASQLVFQRGVLPDAVYSFKHALVQDAAHGSLLRSSRQQLHAKIAEALETLFPDMMDTQPEVLAQHYAEAGLVENAISYSLKAGERALGHSANREAVQHLTNGLELTRLLPPGSRRDRSEFGLQLALGVAMRVTRGSSAHETYIAFARARELMEEMEGNATLREQMTVLYGLMGVHIIGGTNPIAGREISEECLALAARHADPEVSALAARVMGFALFYFGEFAEAITHLRRTLEFCPLDPESIPDLRFAHDHAASASAYLAWCLFVSGYPEQATRAATDAVVRARAIGHAMTTGTVLMAKAVFSSDLGADPAQSKADSDAAVAHDVEHRLPQYECWARVSQGIAMLRHDDPRGAIEAIHVGMAAAKQAGHGIMRPMHTSHLALAHARIGEPAAGLQLLDRAITELDETQERFFEAELHRIRGEILLKAKFREAGEAALLRALAIARGQHARMWELRAAVTLARLYRDQDLRGEARELLGPVYGWFTEGFDTPDLKEAKALLKSLDE
jgi:class 3 adenylate cyclase/predicted ATPase